MGCKNLGMRLRYEHECCCVQGSQVSTVVVAEGAVVFQDKLTVQLDVSVLAHPVERRDAVRQTQVETITPVACCPDLVTPSLM